MNRGELFHDHPTNLKQMPVGKFYELVIRREVKTTKYNQQANMKALTKSTKSQCHLRAAEDSHKTIRGCQQITSYTQPLFQIKSILLTSPILQTFEVTIPGTNKYPTNNKGKLCSKILFRIYMQGARRKIGGAKINK